MNKKYLKLIEHIHNEDRRKAVTLADLRNVAAYFDRNNVPRNGRYITMESDMYYQLIGY